MSSKINHDEMTAEELEVYEAACDKFEAETVREMTWSEAKGAYLSERLAHMEGQLFHGIGDPEEVRAAINAARDDFENGDATEYYGGDEYAESRNDAGEEAVLEYRRSH